MLTMTMITLLFNLDFKTNACRPTTLMRVYLSHSAKLSLMFFDRLDSDSTRVPNSNRRLNVLVIGVLGVETSAYIGVQSGIDFELSPASRVVSLNKLPNRFHS